MINNKVIQYSVAFESAGKMIPLMDTTSVQLPSIEFGADAIKGAGILGEVEIPSLFAMAALTATIAGRVDSKHFAAIGIPRPRKFEVRWFTDAHNQANGSMDYVRHRAIMVGTPKKRDPGKVETNATSDVTVDIALTYYKDEIDGKTVTEIDKLNSKFIVNGEDLTKSIRSFLG